MIINDVSTQCIHGTIHSPIPCSDSKAKGAGHVAYFYAHIGARAPITHNEDNRGTGLRHNPGNMNKRKPYIELNKQNFYPMNLVNGHVHNKHCVHSEGTKWLAK